MRTNSKATMVRMLVARERKARARMRSLKGPGVVLKVFCLARKESLKHWMSKSSTKSSSGRYTRLSFTRA